jgi:hypothetical protein
MQTAPPIRVPGTDVTLPTMSMPWARRPGPITARTAATIAKAPIKIRKVPIMRIEISSKVVVYFRPSSFPAERSSGHRLDAGVLLVTDEPDARARRVVLREPPPRGFPRSHVYRDQIPCHGDHLFLPKESGTTGAELARGPRYRCRRKLSSVRCRAQSASPSDPPWTTPSRLPGTSRASSGCSRESPKIRTSRKQR